MDETAQDSVLRIGLLAPVESLDPRGAWELGRALVATQIFETPYTLREGSDETEPLLFAGPLEPESEGFAPQAFSARLRPDVRFSDGTPLELADAARVLGRSRTLADQATVEVRGDRIVFRLKRPNSRFDLVLTNLDCALLREAGGRLLGTGAFLADAPPSGDGVRLDRNPRYREPVAFRALDFRVYPPDPDGAPRALLEALEKGEVHFSNVLSQEQMRDLRRVRKLFEPGTSTALLFFNTERLAEPALRRAIAMAIDRRAISRLLYQNPLPNEATGLLPPQFGGTLDGILHDPGAARALLREVPDARPRKLSLLVIWGPRPYLPRPRDVAERIADALAAIGLDVEIEVSAGAEDLGARIASGRFDLYLGGWIADTPDPVDFLEALLASHAIPRHGLGKANHANFSRWRSPEVDRDLERLRAEASGRDRIVGRIVRRVAEEVPILPLLYGSATAVHAWRLEGFRLSAVGHPRFASMRLSP